MPKFDAVLIATAEAEISKHKELGYAMFKPLKKRVCIDSHSIEEDGIDFTLKTERNEYLSFTCNPHKINDFFANFEFQEVYEDAIPGEKESKNQIEKKEPAVVKQISTLPIALKAGEIDKTIGGIRSVLFETLQGLRDGTVDIGKASAISDISKTLLYSAKIEIEYRSRLGVVDKDIKMIE